MHFDFDELIYIVCNGFLIHLLNYVSTYLVVLVFESNSNSHQLTAIIIDKKTLFGEKN